jgi:ATP-dependent helicase/nuclease subunit B
VSDCTVVQGSVDALERRLAADVAELQRDDPLRPVVVLVGETLLRAYLRRRLAEITGPYLNVHIVTPGELALRLGEIPLILAGQKPLPLLADRMLAQEAALSTNTYFDAVAGTPGFGQALHRTLVEIRRSGITPDQLSEAAPGSLEPDKLAALAALARRHAELKAGHYDADAAMATPDPERLGAEELLIYGLWDPPALTRRAIAAIGTLRIYLPTTSPVADRAHASFRAWLREELHDSTIELDAVEPTSALGHLQRRLGSDAPLPPNPADGTVRIASAPDPNREVRDALRTCLRWAREDGIAFHEMVIAYRQADPYRPLIAGALREAKLPAYIDEGTPLAELPLGRRALALLDLLGGDLERASVIAFAADGGFPDATRERFPGSAAAWDGFSRKAGVVRGWDQWRDRLQAYRDAEAQRTDEDGNRPDWLDKRLSEIDGLRGFVQELAERIAERPPKGTWSEHLAHLATLFEPYLDGHDPITGALTALARLDDLTEEISPERFDRTVRSVIEGLTADDARSGRAGAFRARGINVVDVNSLRHMRFRAVCVVGLAERHFPPSPKEDPLLLDAERTYLNQAMGWQLPLRAQGADTEPLQFGLALGAAEDRLQLSYPRTEHGSGRPLYASGFLRSAAEALAGERIQAEDLDDVETGWFVRLPGGRVGALQLDDALDDVDYDRTLVEQDPRLAIPVVSGERPAVGRGRTAWLARRFDPLLTAYDGGLTAAAQEALAVHPKLSGPMSPSAFQGYAECGLKSFLSRVLGLRALEEPEDLPRITALDRGSLVHLILERVLTELLPGDPPRAERREEHLALIEKIAAEEFESFAAHGLTGHPQLWEIDQNVIGAELRLWYDAEVLDGVARPSDGAAFEVTYGLPLDPGAPSLSRTDAVPLRVGGHELKLSGKIDRLQWREGTRDFVVIDYKTGRQKDKKTAVFDGGNALQLPLYLHGAAHLLGRDSSDGTAEYFYVSRRGRFARHVMTGAQLAASADEFDQILGAFADAMFGGLYPARPGEWTCRYCEFNGLCPHPIEHADRMKTKETDPRLAAVLAAREVK